MDHNLEVPQKFENVNFGAFKEKMERIMCGVTGTDKHRREESVVGWRQVLDATVLQRVEIYE